MHPKPNTTKASKRKNPYQHAFSKALETRHSNSLTFVPMTMQWTRTYHWPLEDNPRLARNTFWPSDHRGHRRCPLKSLTNGIMHCSHHHNQHCYGRCQHQHDLPSSWATLPSFPPLSHCPIRATGSKLGGEKVSAFGKSLSPWGRDLIEKIWN